MSTLFSFEGRNFSENIAVAWETCPSRSVGNLSPKSSAAIGEIMHPRCHSKFYPQTREAIQREEIMHPRVNIMCLPLTCEESFSVLHFHNPFDAFDACQKLFAKHETIPNFQGVPLSCHEYPLEYFWDTRGSYHSK